MIIVAQSNSNKSYAGVHVKQTIIVILGKTSKPRMTCKIDKSVFFYFLLLKICLFVVQHRISESEVEDDVFGAGPSKKAKKKPTKNIKPKKPAQAKKVLY